jgi:predicted Fe-Mo cluster-binding NifX family protein
MKIVITAEGSDLSAATSPRFGRCSTYVFVDTETNAYEAEPNPAASAPGGAGIHAAQFVVEHGVQAVLTGNVGPNAADVLRAADVPIYHNSESTVEATIEAFKAGRLPVAQDATVKAHAGMGVGQDRAKSSTSATYREGEIAALRSMAADLRQQLAEVMVRIEKLEKET